MQNYLTQIHMQIVHPGSWLLDQDWLGKKQYEINGYIATSLTQIHMQIVYPGSWLVNQDWLVKNNMK